jgi:hypothetical protein
LKDSIERFTSSSLPVNLFEYPAKTSSSAGIDHLDERHSAIEMQPKVRTSVSILTLRTEPDAVGECRLKAVEVTSYDIQVPIGDQARQVLPHAPAHDAGLSMMHGETLFEQNCSNVR